MLWELLFTFMKLENKTGIIVSHLTCSEFLKKGNFGEANVLRRPKQSREKIQPV